MKLLNSEIAKRLWDWHDNKPYVQHPLHTNIWTTTARPSIKVSHAFYMNDERDLDPFYLEYDR